MRKFVAADGDGDVDGVAGKVPNKQTNILLA